MRNKFWRKQKGKRLMAWLLTGVMALSGLNVMPVSAASVSSGDGLPVPFNGEVSTVSSGDGAGGVEFELDISLAGNNVTDTTRWSESGGWYKLDSNLSTEKLVQTNGVFGLYPTGSKVKMKEGLDGIQLDGSVNTGGSGQAAIEMDLTNVEAGDYAMALVYCSKNASAATLKMGLKDETVAEVGSSSPNSSTDVTYTTTLASGQTHLVGAGGGMIARSLKLSKLEDVAINGTVSCVAGTTLPATCSLTFDALDGSGNPIAGKTYAANINVADGTYSVNLPASSFGTVYGVTFSDGEYIFNPSVETINVIKGAPETKDFAVQKVSVYTLSGSYKNGLGEDWTKLTNLTFEPLTDSTYEDLGVTLDKTAGTYSVKLEKGTAYSVTAEGINDYVINIPEEGISYTQDTILDLEFQKKPFYPVAISLGSTPNLTGKNITYTFTHTDESVYNFTDASAITLRDGKYKVSLGGDFEQMAYTIDKGAEIEVNGAAVNHAITFKALTSWSFGSNDFTAGIEGTTGWYRGLYVDATTGKLAPHSSGTAQFNNTTKIQVPVTGNCSIAVSAYQAPYALYTINGTQADTNNVTTTVDYVGGAGTIDIVSTGSAYIASITVVYPAEEVQFVPQPVMPFVPEDDTDANTAADTDGIPRANKKANLTVQPVGQKLNLSQIGGSFADKFADTKDITYYLFPKTADNNVLEFDLVVTESKETGNAAGFFGGLFTDNYVSSLGLRAGGTKIRGIYSKNGGINGGSFAGAGSPSEELVGLNNPIHYVIAKEEGKTKVTVTFKDAEGVEQSRTFNQGMHAEPDGTTATEFYYGFALSNISATITNMVYMDEAGQVLYDQNSCYYPKGTAPAASNVTAVAAESREYIEVSWQGNVPENDGTYVVEMQKDGGEWTELTDDVTGFGYRYEIPAGDGGDYLFRVCGQLGQKNLGGTRTGYATMSTPVFVLGALAKPIVNITAAASDITLNWEAIEGAEYYQVFRYSFDEGEAGAVCVAERLAETAYKDTNVTAEMPYYYQVKAVSDTANNSSPLSDTVWQVPTAGHTGDYVYEDEATEIFISKKSYDTVFTDKVVLEGNVYGKGTIEATVNGGKAASQAVEPAGAFSFELTVEEGRNDVNLLFTDENGNVTRKTFNFVYLTNYDMVVDSAFTGTDGEAVDGIPTYKTVQAAVDAASGSDRTVILVLAGSYEERLVVNTPNISLIGEDRENTLVHFYPGVLGEKYEAGGDMDKRCATVIGAGATGFSAENISFANDYVYSTPDGKSNKSADAVRVEADNAAFVNVKMTGVQDTLYMHSGKQYYYKCLIEGLVDYIYSGDKARSFFNDCELRFVYEATKKQGYVAAPKTAADASYGLTFYNCVVTAEEGCSGNAYLLARPWGETGYVTWIDCYMGKVVNERTPYTDWNAKVEDAKFYEYGTYGPGFMINADRKQISPAKAEAMVSDSYLGWAPDTAIADISAGSYVGSIVTNRDPQFDTGSRADDTYMWTEGDDTGLKLYDMEGYASAYGVTGGGLLKENNDNYYKVKTAEEFLDALLKIKETGKNSVIEMTADINLGCNEVANFEKYESSKLLTPYSAQALTHPTLIESGVSKLNMEGMANLTIFSLNGASIKHANITMKKSENIMIRNIKFDELWEWDEATGGDYDRNDWDYMTIDDSCDGIWIDHCTFYKAYDGIVDVKNPNPIDNVTISWCEFLPGSEGDVFFDVMMDDIFAHPENYPTYQHMLDEGMTQEQVYMYAYGQKKTHLLGQSDDAVNAAGIRVTLANNYYKNSMDRMPRLRYGESHVYNCVMDAQDLLDVRNSIKNEEIAKKIVSNGAISTCDAQVLLENCYISGIMNALNSGNDESPSGYINAINSVYYMDGVPTDLTPKSNSITDDRVLVTDADAFISGLPYADYKLYNAELLDGIVIPRAGAGKVALTVLQWEKESYNAEWQDPEVIETEHKVEIEYGTLPESVMTDEIKAATGCETVEELMDYLKTVITEGAAADSILPGISKANTQILDVEVMVSFDEGLTWEAANASNFPKEGVLLTLPYPSGTNAADYDFIITHLVTMNCNDSVPGTLEFFAPVETEQGLQIRIMSASPFAIGWKAADEADDDDDDDDDSEQGGNAENGGAGNSGAQGGNGGKNSPLTYDSSLFDPDKVIVNDSNGEEAADTNPKMVVPPAAVVPQPTMNFSWFLILAVAALGCAAAVIGIQAYRSSKKEDME